MESRINQNLAVDQFRFGKKHWPLRGDIAFKDGNRKKKCLEQTLLPFIAFVDLWTTIDNVNWTKLFKIMGKNWRRL